MKTFSARCALFALTASLTRAANYKSPWTAGSLTNGDKSLTAAGYTDWSLEGEGETQKMKQELVQTLTWGEEADELEMGEMVQVYIIQPNAEGTAISCFLSYIWMIPSGSYSFPNYHYLNRSTSTIPDIPQDMDVKEWLYTS